LLTFREVNRCFQIINLSRKEKKEKKEKRRTKAKRQYRLAGKPAANRVIANRSAPAVQKMVLTTIADDPVMTDVKSTASPPHHLV
jgi:hypothetical protein